MTLPTFNPPVAPSPGTGIKRELKILEAEFGDGFSQPTPAGLNHMRKNLALAWDTLTEAQMQAIDGFLADQKGTLPFYFSPAGSAAPLKVTCKEWTAKLDGTWSITATFVECFTNET